MSSLKAFGFQVRKGKTKDAQWSDSSTCTKAADHSTLPWLAPSAKQPPVKTKSTIVTTKSASIEPVSKKKATSSASKSNTITRYFTRTPTTTPQQGISMKNDTNANVDADGETCLCVVRKRIPITSIWSTLLEEYSFSVDDSDDPSDDDDDDSDFYYGHVEQHQQGSREDMMMLDTVMTSMEPRGTRRKIRDDDDDEGGGDLNGTSLNRRLHSRSKISKTDLVSAFQQVLTMNPRIIGVPVTNMLKEMEQEQDDQDDEEEDRTRNVRKRMTQEEAATLLQLITEEFLLY
ncbi:hypothetical protein O0I10_000040 [Lichtheimia ornata]|uniref:Uncharacterized protein n=1 Tax=Lichtheimia ornata TaxID=688661 RepID=A0AAD8DJM5_9FUNG|nr:uncharacterized protein O0I10_000040 [Lichtheimia ornata]KAJ8663767.1 hypothetical protein O0I10_000040 [Lichtheimia ornata]